MPAYREYVIRKHPRTGERFAVELDVLTDDSTKVTEEVINRVVGPLHHTDPSDPSSLALLINNANHGDAEDDAIWFQRELDRWE